MAPRGVPQIDVSFEVGADGLLTVSAKDKGSGKGQSLTISSHDGRLSQEDIERMVGETAKFAEQDRILREQVAAKNALENTAYSLKNQLGGELGEKLSDDDKEALNRAITETIEWIDAHDNAEKEELEAKQKELESVIHPIMSKLYGPTPGGSVPGGAQPSENPAQGPRVEEMD